MTTPVRAGSVAALLLAVLTSAPSPPASGTPTPAQVARAGDTTVLARPGDRLVLRDVRGGIEVVGRDERTVRVEAEGADGGVVRVSRNGSEIVVAARGRRLSRSVRLAVPRWLELDLRGTHLAVSVEGMRAAVAVTNAEGDMTVRDVEGPVSLRTVDGLVDVEDVRGPVQVSSVDEAIRLRRIRGDVRVASTDGDVTLDDVVGASVDVVVTDGDLIFAGALARGGSYSFVTHDGDIVLTLPAGTGADASVATFDGSFEADFTVTVDRFEGGRETRFRLGDGGPRLVIQAFDGDIRLRSAR